MTRRPSFKLRPSEGFDWTAVSWGGPDQIVSCECSYCEAPLGEPGDPDYEVPLIIWNADGWCAQFCAECCRKWWGMS